ncbi:DUF3109 family protein [Bacillus salipaludis]|uniref:DUF3109 family protein n=1 Tax=Bacillus salipaludis TaxID=2547811 RepID=A0A4R5VJM3_9BACI|nr:DUF3109 family protein [Bacillus salipaludis]TDK54748.1 DUF3109 family protein [Bacillus salipaludis]
MRINKKAKNYSFITFPMSRILKNNANSYIERNFNKTIFEYKGNLFDIKSLNRLVNLDCLNCYYAHTRLCCEGSPYPPIKEDIKEIEHIVDKIFRDTQSHEDYKQTKKHINNIGLINQEGSFTSNCNKCIFFIRHDSAGNHVCAIHSFALKNNIDYTTLKPKGCMMYPIDMVDLTDGKRFIFGADEETVIDIIESEDGSINMATDNKGFSRWNSHDLQFICLNRKERKLILDTKRTQSIFGKSSLPDSMFKLKDYIPAYMQEKNLLISLFGMDSYKFIEKKSNEIFKVKQND